MNKLDGNRRSRPRNHFWLGMLSGVLLSTACQSRLGPVPWSTHDRPPAEVDSFDGTDSAFEHVPSRRADGLDQAKRALDEGETRFASDDSSATGYFLDATILSWQSVFREGPSLSSGTKTSATRLYHSSLRRTLESAQRFDQLDPNRGIRLDHGGREVEIPICYHAFAWQPEDFNEWLPVTDYDDNHLATKHRQPGWGVPMVVVRRRDSDERFMDKALPFSATVMLRPSTDPNSLGHSLTDKYVLEVFNPLAVKSLSRDDGGTTPLAWDTSAPIAWLGQHAPHLKYEAFMRPDRVRSTGRLYMLEPYQPGKIPVIFVHGLASDPLTWNGLLNELRAVDWFNDNYQVWTFGYSSGRPFLRSAADMRRECAAAIESLDGQHSDPALQRSVIVGHSMGGLISKLQITHSQERLWQAFADRPLESLTVGPAAREYLAELFFFEPLPFVERVVFMGTPHGGSPIADEVVGRFASHLVSRSHEFSDMYRELVKQNSTAVNPFFAKHIPTSIDMLEPEDPCLLAMRQLDVDQKVRMHSVIGTGRHMLIGGRADGVVPVSSAHHGNVESELLVNAIHQHVQSHPESVQELQRILTMHLQRNHLAAVATQAAQ